MANVCAFQLTDVRSNLTKHYKIDGKIETFLPLQNSLQNQRIIWIMKKKKFQTPSCSQVSYNDFPSSNRRLTASLYNSSVYF